MANQAPVITFPVPLIVRFDPGVHGKFTLTEDFRMDVSAEGGKPLSIIVPKGFQTDGASIPPIFRWFLPRWGRYGEAAVIHDWLYSTWSNRAYGSITRIEADRIFLEAMHALGCRWYRRWPMYWAVRLGGRWAFKGDATKRRF